MTDLRTQLQYQTEQQNRHEMEMERLKQRINESSDTLKMLKQYVILAMSWLFIV